MHPFPDSRASSDKAKENEDFSQHRNEYIYTTGSVQSRGLLLFAILTILGIKI